MKISARNTLKGKVKKITTGLVNSEVVVELPGGMEVVSVITKTSAEALASRQPVSCSPLINGVFIPPFYGGCSLQKKPGRFTTAWLLFCVLPGNGNADISPVL